MSEWILIHAVSFAKENQLSQLLITIKRALRLLVRLVTRYLLLLRLVNHESVIALCVVTTSYTHRLVPMS